MARKFMKANIGESQSQRLSDIMAKLKPFCQLQPESVRYLRSIYASLSRLSKEHFSQHICRSYLQSLAQSNWDIRSQLFLG